MHDHDKTIPGYTRDNKRQDRRAVPYSNSKMMNPMITWAMIFSIVVTTGTGTFYISRLEGDIKSVSMTARAMHDSAMNAIRHEEAMRTTVSANVDKNVEEVKDDLKELRKDLKEEADETQQLLRELLQQQNSN